MMLLQRYSLNVSNLQVKLTKSNLYVFLQTGAFNNGYGGNGKITVLFGFET